MTYNVTGIGQNTTSFVTFAQGTSDVLLGGWLGAIFLIGISTILFMAFMNATNDPNRSVAATCFVAFILAILFRAISLLPDLGLYITLILTAGGLAITWKRD